MNDYRSADEKDHFHGEEESDHQRLVEKAYQLKLMSSGANEAVPGMDIMEDDEKQEMRPLMLAGTLADGKEQDVALLGPDLIKQSLVLTNTRWSDKTTDRIVFPILPALLQLLVRFGKLVTQHNQLVARRSEGGSKSTTYATASGDQLLPLPIKTLPSDFTFQNRAMHLPYIIGFSPVLAEFLNIVAERPYTGLQCAQAAEHLLWEPAQTAFLYKFGNFCKGLSHPFIELIWPESAPKAVSLAAPESVSLAAPESTSLAAPEATSLAAPEATSLAAPEATSLAAPEATSLAAPEATSLAAPEATSLAAQEVRWLDTVVRLTGKFFEPAPLTNKNLLPPTPLGTLTSVGRRKTPVKRKFPNNAPGTLSAAGPGGVGPGTQPRFTEAFIAPPPPAFPLKTPLSLKEAVAALERWIENSIGLRP